MARIWKEKCDPKRHRDHSSSGVTHDRPLQTEWAYLVNVCGFTFEFGSVDQTREHLAFFGRKIHASSRDPAWARDNEKGEWQQPVARLPLYLREEPKREKVVRALTRAVEQFSADRATTSGC